MSQLSVPSQPISPETIRDGLPLASKVGREYKLGQHSQHKHTVRYSTTDPDAPVDNVYVKRSAFKQMPAAVWVSVKEA